MGLDAVVISRFSVAMTAVFSTTHRYGGFVGLSPMPSPIGSAQQASPAI